MTEKAKTAFERFRKLAQRVVTAPKPQPDQENKGSRPGGRRGD